MLRGDSESVGMLGLRMLRRGVGVGLVCTRTYARACTIRMRLAHAHAWWRRGWG